MTDYLYLTELVEDTKVELGQILVPIKAFGFTYEKLERIFLQALYRYQTHYPLSKETVYSVSPGGITIADAQQVEYLRYHYSETFRESNPKIDRSSWEFDEVTRLLTSEITSTYRVYYLADYQVDNFPYQAKIENLYALEDTLNIRLRAVPKKGTLTISLDEGFLETSSTFTVDPGTDLFTLTFDLETQTQSALYGLLNTGHILRVATDGEVGSLLPSPLAPNTDYYVIKVSDATFRLATTREYALANTFIDITTTGVGTLTLTKQDFTLTEDIVTYNTYYSVFGNIDITENTIEISELFGEKIVNGQEMTDIITTNTLPNPLQLNTKYYVIKLSNTLIKLASTKADALLGNAIDITNVGSGEHTIRTPNNTITSIRGHIIDVRGTLGEGSLNLLSMELTLKNVYGFAGTLMVDLVSKYKAIQDVKVSDTFFSKIFKQKFALAVGKQKSTVRIEGLPFDVSVDELANTTAAELEQEILQDIETGRRTKWWHFG